MTGQGTRWVLRAPEGRRAGLPQALRWLRSSDAGRFPGLDLARALALVGMMTAHILPHTVNGAVSWQQRLVTGNSAAVFAILAGVTMGLLSGRTEPYRGGDRHATSLALAVRAGLVLALGLVLDRLHVPGVGVILPYYGALFILGLPFLGLRARALFFWAGAWAVLAPVVSTLVRESAGPLAAGGFGGQPPLDVVRQLLLYGDYPAFTWLAYLLCGLGVGRLRLGRRGVAVWLVGAGGLLVMFATLISTAVLSSPAVRLSLLASSPTPTGSWATLEVQMSAGLGGTTPTGSWWWLLVTAPHSGAILDLTRSSGLALAVLGLALLAMSRAPRAWRSVFGAGTMTLSLYSLHLVMLLPGTWPDYGHPRWWPEVLLVVGIGGLFHVLRLKGPLEATITLLSTNSARIMAAIARSVGHPTLPVVAEDGRDDPPTSTAPRPANPASEPSVPGGPSLAGSGWAADLESRGGEGPTPSSDGQGRGRMPGAPLGIGARVRRGAMWAGIGSVVFRLTSLVPALLVAHILSPREFGVFAVALTAYSIIGSMGELGIGAYLQRDVPDVADVAPTVATLCVVAAGALAVAMFLLAEPFASLLGAREAAPAVRIMSLLVAMVGLFAVPGAHLTRTFRQKEEFSANVIAFFPSTGVLLFGALNGFGATAFAWGRVAGTIIVGVLITRLAPQRLGFQWRYVRRLVAFGLPLTGANLFNFLLLNVDFIVIGRSLGATSLGAYSLAFSISSWATALLSGMVSVAIPAVGYAASDVGRLRATIREMVSSFAVISFAICAAVSALAVPLVRVAYGTKWEAALPVLSVLPIFGALNLLALLLGNLMIGLGKPRQLFVVQGVWLLVLAPSLVLGVRLDGIRGAATAHVATLLLVVIPLFLWRLDVNFGIRAPMVLRALWRPTLAAITAWGFARAVTRLGLPDLAALSLGGAVGVVVYTTIAWPLLVPHLRRVLARLPDPWRARLQRVLWL